MGIATFLKSVINVTDLDDGLRFWSEVSGLDPGYVDPAGRFAGLGQHQVEGAPSSVILLQLVSDVEPNGGTHLDFTAPDIEVAIDEIIAIGGECVRSLGSYPEDQPLLEWAVMSDPWGNHFCLVRDV